VSPRLWGWWPATTVQVDFSIGIVHKRGRSFGRFFILIIFNRTIEEDLFTVRIQRLKQTVPFAIVGAVVAVFVFGLVPKSQSDPEFKNVQVLTDLSMDELKEYMAEVTEYLGVEKCTFCHVRDKSSDEVQHKVVAREYMKLVRELNGGFFKEKEHKVTCFTCHRGNKEVINHPGEEGEAH
jgi:hypothetical protein